MIMNSINISIGEIKIYIKPIRLRKEVSCVLIDIVNWEHTKLTSLFKNIIPEQAAETF